MANVCIYACQRHDRLIGAYQCKCCVHVSQTQSINSCTCDVPMTLNVTTSQNSAQKSQVHVNDCCTICLNKSSIFCTKRVTLTVYMHCRCKYCCSSVLVTSNLPLLRGFTVHTIFRFCSISMINGCSILPS